MKTKECPSCAMEVKANSKVCPVCQYEFAESGTPMKWIALLLAIIIFLLSLFLL
jgi:RNA polymerase subunit RPABC4/transcription elongation factor Spt4